MVRAEGEVITGYVHSLCCDAHWDLFILEDGTPMKCGHCGKEELT